MVGKQFLNPKGIDQHQQKDSTKEAGVFTCFHILRDLFFNKIQMELYLQKRATNSMIDKNQDSMVVRTM